MTIIGAMSGSYTFDAKNGCRQGQSPFAWAHKSQTAGRMKEGERVVTSGKVPGYTLVARDVGIVMELTVQPRNELTVTGDIRMVTTEDFIGAEPLNQRSVNSKASPQMVIHLPKMQASRTLDSEEQNSL